MRKPLLIAACLSFCLHTAIVLAFVSIPAPVVVPPPAPEGLANVTLAPDFATPQQEPQPAPQAPLTAEPPPQAPIESTSGPQETSKNSLPSVAPAETPPPPSSVVAESLPQSVPPIAPPALPDGLPEGTSDAASPPPSTPPASPPDQVAEAGKPAADVVADAGAGTSGAAGSGETGSTATPGAVPESSQGEALRAAPSYEAAPALAAPSSLPGAGVPSFLATGAPSLFPSDTVPGLASQADVPAALSLPVISSDGGDVPAPSAAAQALDALDLPAVSDAGPSGEAQEGSPGAAERARTFLPPALHHRAGPARSGSQPGRAASRRGVPGGSDDGAIYDPRVRQRYSSELFSFLRRRLVFPGSGQTGTVTVRFVLERSGAIQQLLVVGSSGSPELDQQALAIVRRAAPFPRFPAGFGSSQLEVTLPVTFK